MDRPKLIRDWKNGYVRATETIINGRGEMPKGTIYFIEDSGVIARLRSLGCDCCGLKFSFTMKGKNKFMAFEWLGYDNPQTT